MLGVAGSPRMGVCLVAEAGGFLSLRPAWSSEQVPGQPGLHRETLSGGKKFIGQSGDSLKKMGRG